MAGSWTSKSGRNALLRQLGCCPGKCYGVVRWFGTSLLHFERSLSEERRGGTESGGVAGARGGGQGAVTNGAARRSAATTSTPRQTPLCRGEEARRIFKSSQGGLHCGGDNRGEEAGAGPGSQRDVRRPGRWGGASRGRGGGHTGGRPGPDTRGLGATGEAACRALGRPARRLAFTLREARSRRGF